MFLIVFPQLSTFHSSKQRENQLSSLPLVSHPGLAAMEGYRAGLGAYLFQILYVLLIGQ